MSKMPKVEHDYTKKKDRFDIRLTRYKLEEKWMRRELLDIIIKTLDRQSRKTTDRKKS